VFETGAAAIAANMGTLGKFQLVALKEVHPVGYIEDKLRQEQSMPAAAPPRWVTCRYCRSQVPAAQARDDFCSRLCRLRWQAEWQSLQRLNSEYASADEIVQRMDNALKRER
jgi:hypothetical protein